MQLLSYSAIANHSAMKNYIQHHPWKVIENKFHPEWNEVSESLCSLGNGYMGHRGNFEEKFTGKTLQGNYLAGIYYPDKTRVGWWKNGYPEYFAKVLNAVNWIGIGIIIGGKELDLNEVDILSFSRELNMKEGYLLRKTLIMTDVGTFEIQSKRFCSIVRREIGVIEYSISSRDFNGIINIKPYLDFDVTNKDSNYDEKFWDAISEDVHMNEGYVIAQTRKTAYRVGTGMLYDVFINNTKQDISPYATKKIKYVSSDVDIQISEGDKLTIHKYAAIVTSENHDKEALHQVAEGKLHKAYGIGFKNLLEEHIAAWDAKWQESDIRIDGDVAAQQGIRFNIFHLNQTYTGEDPRLNIGPKGFTGEKYGGSTYWDTEAYCLPFYLATADPKVAKNLLVYRHRHLAKAIENAKKLGFKDGAALYPMVTMTGEECHNEWEITFEEIHRNGAIAYAIYDYIRYTGNKDYLATHGLEVLIGISRFWSQRVNYSRAKNKYVMLGVTGPNEYENNVDNNWHTNHIATWCMEYCLEAIDYVKSNFPDTYASLKEHTCFKEGQETERWKNIIDNMHYPYDKERDVFLQQENFLDKELKPVTALNESDRPLCQNWSWDRILRSCFIKQADTLQGLYFFEDKFDVETIRRNFHFYEPMTTHESSLSPCVHAILAAVIGDYDKAYEMYLRTARLDLDDYNNDTEDGLHITSMGGTWMAFVKGFAGMRVWDNSLHFNPFLPKNWNGYSFRIRFRANLLDISVNQSGIHIKNESKTEIVVNVYDEKINIPSHTTVQAHLPEKVSS